MAAIEESDDDIFDGDESGTLIFSKEVEKAIAEVFPSSDPLDSNDFNAVEYINALFPTEQSVANIDDVMKRMRLKIRRLDDDIRGVVRGQTNVGHDGRQSLEEAQKAIQELFIRIHDIKEKAELSETRVKEITRDIKQLDHAKRNLTSSITTLNHLHFLVGGVHDLSNLIRRRQYSEVANLMQGVVNVLEHFDKYRSISQIRDLANDVARMRDELGTQIMGDFKEAMEAYIKGGKLAPHLGDACNVVQVLEPKLKKELQKWFVSLHLSDYKRQFNEREEIAWLDKIDRRYAWLKRTLINFEEDFSRVFPEDWGMQERVAIEFCEWTRGELSKLMAAKSSNLEVKLLLFAIQKTTGFEKLMATRFAVSIVQQEQEEAEEEERLRREEALRKGPSSSPSTTAAATTATDGSGPPGPATVGATSAQSAGQGSDPIRERYERYLRQQEEEQQRNATDDAEAQEEPAQPKKKPSIFLGLVSRCFEPHLNVYIESQDRNLAELMDRLADDYRTSGCPTVSIDETGAPSGSTSTVLPSCSDLFIFYKKCLVQCAQLSTGEALVHLSEVFKRYLKEYGNRLLLSNMPKTSTGGGGLTSLLKDSEGVKLSMEEVAQTCCFLSTAEYCLDTTQSLEEKLKEKIEVPLQPKINLGEEQDLFHNIIATCIQLLVQCVESACEPALLAMVKVHWQNIEAVGDQSAYITAIQGHIKQIIPIIRENLASSRKYFNNFCLKLANSLIPRFINTIYKCKPVGTVGAEQLLLDTHSFKTTLLNLPTVNAAVARKAPPSYIKIVTKGMAKAELILKVVMSPHDLVEEFVKSYVKLLDDPDVANFQKVLEMKGLKRGEVHTLLDVFKQQRLTSDGATAAPGQEESGSRIRKLERLIKKNF
eukprot:scpid28331/ scgid26521/ Vacuolar protein sorting-associated protein 53 homolog